MTMDGHDRHSDLGEVLSDSFVVEAVEELRDILISGIHHNRMLKRMLSMIALRLSAYDRVFLDDAIEKSPDFYNDVDKEFDQDLLIAILYFITKGDLRGGIPKEVISDDWK